MTVWGIHLQHIGYGPSVFRFICIFGRYRCNSVLVKFAYVQVGQGYMGGQSACAVYGFYIKNGRKSKLCSIYIDISRVVFQFKLGIPYTVDKIHCPGACLDFLLMESQNQAVSNHNMLFLHIIHT